MQHVLKTGHCVPLTKTLWLTREKLTLTITFMFYIAGHFFSQSLKMDVSHLASLTTWVTGKQKNIKNSLSLRQRSSSQMFWNLIITTYGS